MSSNAQLEYHPDAESLNAFAEQVLAGQERERIVAHLAMCGRCREIVFLAQEANVELEPDLVAAAASAPETEERAPWFRSWKVALIPVAALAAGISVAYIVHIRQQVPESQMAQVEHQAGNAGAIPQAPAPQVETAKSAQVVEKQAQPKSKGLQQADVAAAPAPPPSAMVPVSGNEVALATTGRAADELKAMPDAALRQQETALVAGQMQGLSAKKAAPMSADKSEQEQNRAVAAQTPMTRPSANAAPAAPAAMSAGVARKAGGSYVAFLTKPAGLPSGLAAVSTAAEKQNVLSVDEAGSVFLSTDGGMHWNSIGRQWNGKAVAVRTQSELKDGSGAGGASPQTGFELVNDEGEVWVSADGRSWKHK